MTFINGRSITESQDYRIVKVARDLWRSSGPTPLLKQRHLDQFAQDYGQMAVEDLQGGRLYNLHGKPVPASSIKVLPDDKMKSFVPTASCPALGHH